MFLTILCIFLPQMRLPSKPYSTLPIYSLGPGAVAKEEESAASAPAEPEKHPFGSGHSRHSLRRSVYKYVTVVLYSPFFLYTDERCFKMLCQISCSLFLFVLRLSKHSSSSSKDSRSQDEPELPKEITEDWVTMEICIDCKKFITEIISSSKRSLCMASKRARLNRKTQSFYMSSSNSINFMPSERTINEV